MLPPPRHELTVEGIRFQRSERFTLRGESFRLNAGLNALLGRNGSGKSTFLRLIAGLARPQSGSVRLNGDDLHKLSREKRSRLMAWMPPTLELAFPFAVLDVVLAGRFPHHSGKASHSDRALCETLCEELGIGSLKHRFYGSLSSGEQRKVALARTLSLDAALCLLDEPFAHLDTSASLEILAVLRRRAEAGQVFFISIHDLHLARLAFDSGVLIQDGCYSVAMPIADALSPERLKSVFGLDAHFTDGENQLKREAAFHLLGPA